MNGEDPQNGNGRSASRYLLDYFRYRLDRLEEQTGKRFDGIDERLGKVEDGIEAFERRRERTFFLRKGLGLFLGALLTALGGALAAYVWVFSS